VFAQGKWQIQDWKCGSSVQAFAFKPLNSLPSTIKENSQTPSWILRWIGFGPWPLACSWGTLSLGCRQENGSKRNKAFEQLNPWSAKRPRSHRAACGLAFQLPMVCCHTYSKRCLQRLAWKEEGASQSDTWTDKTHRAYVVHRELLVNGLNTSVAPHITEWHSFILSVLSHSKILYTVSSISSYKNS
jgi:hypothetical protein